MRSSYSDSAEFFELLQTFGLDASTHELDVRVGVELVSVALDQRHRYLTKSHLKHNNKKLERDTHKFVF